MRILTLGFSLEVSMWPADKIFGKKKVALLKYKQELAQLRDAENIALVRCKLYARDPKKEKESVEEEKVTIRVADQHGDGLINMLAGSSALGHGISFVMRLFGRLTDRGSLKIAVSAPLDVLEAGSKSILEQIRARKYVVELEIKRIESELNPTNENRVRVPDDFAKSEKPKSSGPYPER